MINLKLFTSLQNQAIANILLRPSSPGVLQFYLMSSSVNYNIIVTGRCEGELPNSNPIAFDILLSSISPLFDKNYDFRIEYKDTLRFVEVHDRFYLEPLCVEHISDMTTSIVKRYLDTMEALSAMSSAKEKLEAVEEELRSTLVNYDEIKKLDLSGGPPSNPFGSVDDLSNTKVDKKYLPKIADLKRKQHTLQKETERIKALDFASLKRLSIIAQRYNSIVSMCDTYAVVELRNCYAVQKCENGCGARAVSGKLLHRLLQEESGTFYSIEDEVFFHSFEGTGSTRTDTVIFLQPYAVSTVIDSSIVTKGAVREKYTLNIKGLLSVSNTVLSKFDTMEFDMGASRVILSNERGERLVYRFETENAMTPSLRKAMRGETVENIEFSVISVPREIQKIIGIMNDNFTIYVKDRKIVLQSDTLYLVFAR